MKKLLILTSTFPKGKTDAITARFVWDLAESLKEFYQVFVLCPHAKGLALKEEWQGVQIYRFKYCFFADLQLLSSGNGMASDIRSNFLAVFQIPGFFIAQYLNAKRIIKINHIDTVNSHWIVPQGLIGAFLKKKLGIRHVVTAHAADVFLLKRMAGAGKKLADFIISYTDLVLPVSTYIKQTLDSLTSQRYAYQIIPMAANRNFSAASNDIQNKTNRGLKLLFVGKFTEKKGIIHLLEAMRILKKEKTEVFLELVGGGILENDLRDFVNRNDLAKNISFLGWVPNEKLPELYRSCDILIVPSVFDRKGETEGMPVVIAEALACGRPVLASRISGIPDIIQDGYNGWLVEPGSSLGIAKKIEEIGLIDLAPFQQNALKTATGLTYNKTAIKYKEAIEKV